MSRQPDSPTRRDRGRKSPESSAQVADISRLEALVARLRAPDGCPWDREQGFTEIRSYMLEEAHEVAAAIDGGDLAELAQELGDLLFQVVFLSQLGREQNAFDLAAVIDGIHAKMVARHPHVFGGETLADAQAVRQAWERRKLETNPGRRSLLEGVPISLPALVGAYRMTQKAAAVGFDWPDARAVTRKVHEELAEVAAALELADGEARRAAATEELGDLLFAVANLARHLEIDPEAALAQSNQKFRRRFAAVEADFAAREKNLADATLVEMDAVWEEVKAREKG